MKKKQLMLLYFDLQTFFMVVPQEGERREPPFSGTLPGKTDGDPILT